jgi:hypothetical protein
MFEILSEHQFWTAVVIYWMFSAAVSSMPEPAPNGSSGYLWFYRFLHSIAGNITTAFGSKIPGVKTMTVILLIPILFSVSACRAHYAIHPGALSTADSAAYDTLLVASATIDEARMAYQLGRLPLGDEAERCLPRSNNPKCYEEDHLISLQAGGHPTDAENLWPQPYNSEINRQIVGARQKDLVESFIHDEICFAIPDSRKNSKVYHPHSGLELKRGQEILAKDWFTCYLSVVRGEDCK